MAIFQKSVINKHLTNLDKEQVETAYLKFKENYSIAKIEKIKQLKEEEYQDGFLRDVFVDVFGYTLKPDDNHNLVREFKNQDDGRKADGAIIRNDGVNPIAIAVIELKSTKTKDLKNITDQAFNYKNNQPDCKYVITSNFQKLRFYIDYANEFEEFDLFQIANGSTDGLTRQFKFLYLILNTNSIFSDLPLKLKEETKFHEQEVSDKLYKDYSNFKRKLFDNLTKNHPDSNKLTLFKKSQKLLDRFLFILFAEDSGLLPPNSISRIIKRYEILKNEDAYKPIYDIFKQYFGYMNIGRKGQTDTDNIPAYNGGLFYPDELLDKLKIDDKILIDELLNLSEYDFNTEVDVNILGHIFEHSLSEIEEITAEIEADKTDGLTRQQKTKKTSKRKKDGVFYTPKYITQYIVENTIGTLCNEKRIELEIEEIEFDGTYRTKDGNLSAKGKKLYQKLKDYKEWLLSLKIVDPACGSGAFLNQALNYLIHEHKNIDDIIAELTNTALRLFDTDKAILENNLYGVDINEESIEIAKLSLWLRTAQKGRKLSVLSNNIKCGNSLIDDPEIAGDKAFDWNVEFPQIFKEKEKKAWHITFVLHNSRYSLTDGLTRQLEPGFIAPTYPKLDTEQEIILAEELSKSAKEYDLNILGCNICADHVHAIIVCEKDELQTLVGKWKGRTAYTYNRRVNPSVDDQVAMYSDGTKEKFWAKSFHPVLIKDKQQLENTIDYIRNNREKHNLSTATSGLTRWLKETTCTPNHAFRTEYNGGFDVVIGNPPYAKYNAISPKEKKYLINSNIYGKTGDLSEFFIKKVLTSLLKKNARFSFIVPKGLTYVKSWKDIRNNFLNNVSLVGLYDVSKAFKDALYEMIIFNVINTEPKNSTLKCGYFDEQNKIEYDFDTNLYNDNIFFLGFPKSYIPVIKKIKTTCVPVSNFMDYWYGKGGMTPLVNTQEKGIPVLTGKEIGKYYFNKPKEKWFLEIEKLSDIDKHRAKLNKVVVQDIVAHILNPKPHIKLTASIDENEQFCLNTVMCFSENSNGLKNEFLLSIINSKFISFYYYYFIFNQAIRTMHFMPGYSDLLPIPKNAIKSQHPFVEKADKMLELNKDFQEKKSKFLNRVKDNLNIGVNPDVNKSAEIKISKKLESFYDFDFKTFIAEISKAYKTDGLTRRFTLVQQDEWEEYFNTYKNEINQLQDEINRTDKEIDQMVYELYGLSEEEIGIIENS